MDEVAFNVFLIRASVAPAQASRLPSIGPQARKTGAQPSQGAVRYQLRASIQRTDYRDVIPARNCPGSKVA